VAAFQETIKLKPDWPAAQNNLGVAYMNLGKWKQAISPLKEAVRLKPDYQGAHYNLGLAFLEAGDKKSAVQEYNILRPLNLNNANALYFRIYRKPPPANQP